MFHPTEILPHQEKQNRIAICQSFLAHFCPDASGLLISNRVNIYYCTGTLANGYLWIPQKGAPILFVRKALERAQLESPKTTIRPFRSFSSLYQYFSELGNIPESIAIEYGNLPYDMALRLQNKFPNTTLVNGDQILTRTRARKSDWELQKMRQAGAIHEEAMMSYLPSILRHDMTEHEIGVKLYTFLLNNGYGGPTRLGGFGQELFIGNVTVGDHGDYPNYFNGPQGNKGIHPATPYGGSQTPWRQGSLLTIDAGCTFHGYNTDKTTVYFAGSAHNIPEPILKAHHCCLAIERTIAENLRPGAIPSHLYAQALSMATDAGFQEGFMGYKNNQVPFLGHGIGLVVDEWPVLAHKFELPLEEEMTLAIEPKITLPGYGMVGTENTYRVTPQGGESLTGEPSELICIAK